MPAPVALATLAALCIGGAALADDPRGGLSPEDFAFFESSVRPILVERCGACHASSTKQKAGLSLDSRAGWMRGGDTGPAVVPRKPEESLLLRAVSYEDPDLSMPPKAKLPAAEIAVLREWIVRGAPDPRAGSASRKDAAEFDVGERQKAHWAWQPIRSPSPPQVSAVEWPRQDSDRFVLTRLEAAGLEPAREASRRVWLRRVTFDLIGLPPTPSEITAFLEDDSSDAHGKVVDRLLRSPHFGERWAQHWLDLVRYAESRGHEQDYPIPEAYRYRDYVIRALNADLPYDDFVIEHIAGDLLPEPRIDPETRTDQSIQATGFWHLGDATHSPVDIRGDEAERVASEIDVFGKAFLGLTLGCARCHDHKFDAISAADYYALYGFLQSSSLQMADVSDPEARRQASTKLGALRDGAEPELIRAHAHLLGTSRLEAALTAAPRLLRDETSVATIASETGLEPTMLETLRAALVGTSPRSPLYPVARIAAEPGSADRLRALLRSIIDDIEAEQRTSIAASRARKVVHTVEDGERNFVRSERPVSEDDVLLDFADIADSDTGAVTSPEDWIASGERFGERPAVAASLRLGEGGAPRYVTRPEASADRLSPRLQGMLRTRTFEITSDTLWYEFRGKADVFLAVDSHRVVHGPLHGVVKQRLDGDGDFRWKAHKVRDYIGHRVHVEFTPRGPFALRRIEFSSSTPDRVFEPNRRIVTWLERAADDNDLSVQGLLAGFAREIVTAAEDLAAGRVSGHADRRAVAELLNWTLATPNLFSKARLLELSGEYVTQRKRLEERLPRPVRALALLDGSAENEPVHLRGNHKSRSKQLVPRRLLTALDPSNRELSRRGSGRLELARRLTAPSNPLVSRVLVNRVWHHLFGRGIVARCDDFGVMGDRPTHPDLLDHLASGFMADGWSLKRLVRRLVLSSTYRMSSAPTNDRAREIDPTNRLLHRMRIRRLSAEAIRDSLLFVSGRLDRRLYGPSVKIHITPFMRGNRSPGGSGPMDGDGRRSIYLQVSRNHPSHFLTAFDRPQAFTTMGRRNVSNSPAQPLVLLNDPLVHEQSERWARRLLEQEATSRLEHAYLQAFGRPPRPDERELVREFLAGRSETGGEPARAWTELCHTLFNVKEFTYVN